MLGSETLRRRTIGHSGSISFRGYPADDSDAGWPTDFDARGTFSLFGVSLCCSSFVHQVHQTTMSPSLQNTNGAVLAAAMFCAACVFPWLNDPRFLAYWFVQLFWRVGGADILLS